MSLNRLKILFLSHQRHPKAQLIEELLKKKKEIISTILVGNNFVNVAAASVATALAIAFWGKSGIIYATISLTIVLLIFCEIVPKIYAAKSPERVSFIIAKSILWCVRFLKPFVRIITFLADILLKLVSPHEMKKKPLVSEEEIQAVITIGEKEGVVEKEERKMLLNIFDLADTWVKEIMIPRTDMVCIEENISYDELINLISRSGLSRFPVYQKQIDNIKLKK